MPLIYTVISRYPDIVLCEYSDYHGNFMQITHVILQNSIKYNKKYIIAYDKFKLHYINDRGITYLCLSEDINDEDALAFLIDVQRKLSKTNQSDLKGMNAYQLDNFNEDIKSIMTYYNTHPLVTKAGESIYELNLTKDAVVENIENLIEKCNKVDIIATKAESAKNFVVTNDVADNLRKSDTTRKNKYIIASSVMITLLIVIFCFLSG